MEGRFQFGDFLAKLPLQASQGLHLRLQTPPLLPDGGQLLDLTPALQTLLALLLKPRNREHGGADLGMAVWGVPFDLLIHITFFIVKENRVSRCCNSVWTVTD